MLEKPTILFVSLIPRDYSPYLAKSYGMQRTFDMLPHKYAILTLVAWLRENNCGGDYVWVYGTDENDLAAIDDAISNLRPHALGFSLVTEEMIQHYRLIGLLKERHPDIPVVAGGPHVSALPEHTLKNFPKIDFVCVGEGERTLTELLFRIAAGHGDSGSQGRWRTDVLKQVRGIGFRDDDGAVIVNPGREQIRDINILPDPAYDLIYDENAQTDERSAFPLVCSYGCYFFCTFCSVDHGNYRSINPMKLAARIAWAQQEYGVEYFAIRDSFWPPSRKWLDEFCNEIERRGLKIKFHFQTRAGALDLERLLRLKKIGAQAIAIGVEAGDPEILKSIKKSITVDGARRAIKAINEAGIFSIAFFIFGNKGETRASIQKSIDLATELNASIAFFHVLIALPGAEAFEAVPDAEKDWWMGKSPLPSICDMSVDDMSRLATDSFLRYPLRWSYLSQHVIGGGLSPEFREIAKRLYSVHLRKFILGNMERVPFFRWVISNLKKLRGG